MWTEAPYGPTAKRAHRKRPPSYSRALCLCSAFSKPPSRGLAPAHIVNRSNVATKETLGLIGKAKTHGDAWVERRQMSLKGPNVANRNFPEGKSITNNCEVNRCDFYAFRFRCIEEKPMRLQPNMFASLILEEMSFVAIVH